MKRRLDSIDRPLSGPPVAISTDIPDEIHYSQPAMENTGE